jgi:hypothetical protein
MQTHEASVKILNIDTTVTHKSHVQINSQHFVRSLSPPIDRRYCGVLGTIVEHLASLDILSTSNLLSGMS